MEIFLAQLVSQALSNSTFLFLCSIASSLFVMLLISLFLLLTLAVSTDVIL